MDEKLKEEIGEMVFNQVKEYSAHLEYMRKLEGIRESNDAPPWFKSFIYTLAALIMFFFGVIFGAV